MNFPLGFGVHKYYVFAYRRWSVLGIVCQLYKITFVANEGIERDLAIV